MVSTGWNPHAHNEKFNGGFEWADICYILEGLHKGLFSLGLPECWGLQTSTNNNWWLKAALHQAITGISLEINRQILEDFRNRRQLCMKARMKVIMALQNFLLINFIFSLFLLKPPTIHYLSSSNMLCTVFLFVFPLNLSCKFTALKFVKLKYLIAPGQLPWTYL